MAATTGKYPLEIATPGTEIVMTRVFDAPRDLVFEAHTSCEHVSRLVGAARVRNEELRARLQRRRQMADRAWQGWRGVRVQR